MTCSDAARPPAPAGAVADDEMGFEVLAIEEDDEDGIDGDEDDDVIDLEEFDDDDESRAADRYLPAFAFSAIGVVRLSSGRSTSSARPCTPSADASMNSQIRVTAGTLG